MLQTLIMLSGQDSVIIIFTKQYNLLKKYSKMIDNKKSLKEHLTTGRAVITENGTVYKVIQYPEQTYLVREGGYLCLSQYNDNLETLDGVSDFNIQKIYSTSSPACFVGDEIDGSLIWERPKRTDIKLEAIEKILGYKINIIKDKESVCKVGIKNLLKTGMTVRLNNGILYRVIRKYQLPSSGIVEDFVFVRGDGFMKASEYTPMLMIYNNGNSEFDVQKIYDICDCNEFINMASVGDLIWERKRYMTVEEIEEKLGYKINII